MFMKEHDPEHQEALGEYVGALLNPVNNSTVSLPERYPIARAKTKDSEKSTVIHGFSSLAEI